MWSFYEELVFYNFDTDRSRLSGAVLSSMTIFNVVQKAALKFRRGGITFLQSKPLIE